MVAATEPLVSLQTKGHPLSRHALESGTLLKVIKEKGGEAALDK